MQDELFGQVIAIVSPFAKDKEALKNAKENTSFLKDLQVSSARLVDIILAMEDQFGIEVADDEADKVLTIGAAVNLIRAKLGKSAANI